MQQRIHIRYSMAFKQQVVADLETGRFRTILAAGEHYGIGGATTVRKWLVRFGKNHLIPRMVRVEKPDEADQIRLLKKQIRQLQQALGKTQLENVMNASANHGTRSRSAHHSGASSSVVLSSLRDLCVSAANCCSLF